MAKPEIYPRSNSMVFVWRDIPVDEEAIWNASDNLDASRVAIPPGHACMMAAKNITSTSGIGRVDLRFSLEDPADGSMFKPHSVSTAINGFQLGVIFWALALPTAHPLLHWSHVVPYVTVEDLGTWEIDLYAIFTPIYGRQTIHN